MYNTNTLCTAATNYGKINESKAKEEIERTRKIKIAECGLFIDSEYCGATPDGVVGDKGIVEVKCPYSVRDLTPEEGIELKKITVWKKVAESQYELNKKHK